MPNHVADELWREAVESQRQMATKITYNAPLIEFHIKNRVEAIRDIGELRRVFEIEAGLDYQGTDISFSVLDFGDSLWIVPDTILLETHHGWAKHLKENRGFFKATIYWPPKEWLSGGFLGLGRHLAPKVLKGNTLPVENETWCCKGPLDPVTFQPLDFNLKGTIR